MTAPAAHSELVLLIADNSPLSALSAIRCLDWLLVPGVPVWITDQVRFEATEGSTTPWAAETEAWIRRHATDGRIRVIETPTGRNFRLAHEAWEAGTRDPLRRPDGTHLGERSILDLMQLVEEAVTRDQRVMVLIDERRGRRAMLAAEINVDIVSTRAFFQVLEDAFGIENASSYWAVVLQALPSMDALDEIEQLRPRGA